MKTKIIYVTNFTTLITDKISEGIGRMTVPISQYLPLDWLKREAEGHGLLVENITDTQCDVVVNITTIKEDVIKVLARIIPENHTLLDINQVARKMLLRARDGDVQLWGYNELNEGDYYTGGHLSSDPRQISLIFPEHKVSLYNLLLKSDVIKINDEAFFHTSIHPTNGLEGVTFAKKDNSEQLQRYHIGIDAINAATVVNNVWHVKHIDEGVNTDVTIKCYSTKLI